MDYYLIKKIIKDEKKTVKGFSGDEWLIFGHTNKEEAEQDLMLCEGRLVDDDEPIYDCAIIGIVLERTADWIMVE